MVDSVSKFQASVQYQEYTRTGNSSSTVLIVDDDPRVVEVLKEVLEEEGFRVIYEGDGRSALYSIERRKPDIVLADMRMPVMDGVTLMKEISHRWQDIGVIMMSATESPGGLPVPFIQKPFDLDEVVEMICECQSPG